MTPEFEELIRLKTIELKTEMVRRGIAFTSRQGKRWFTRKINEWCKKKGWK